MTVSWSRGMVTLMLRRLCSLAPRTTNELLGVPILVVLADGRSGCGIVMQAAERSRQIQPRLLEKLEVLAVALSDELVDRNKHHGRRIHAVAQARGLRPVVKYVAEVRVSVCGADFVTHIAQLRIRVLLDVLGFERTRKAGPSGAGLVFVLRAEERLARDYVDVNAGGVVIPIGVPKRRFGVFVLRHRILQGRQRLLEETIGWFHPLAEIPRRWSVLWCLWAGGRRRLRIGFRFTSGLCAGGGRGRKQCDRSAENLESIHGAMGETVIER